ncbi:MAG: primosomal replication protein N [Parashewanella sp.]
MTTNHVSLSGQIKRLKNMNSPAGIPHWIVTLEHKSQQYEAELLRPVYLQIHVILSGKRYAQLAVNLQAGMEMNVEGFLNVQTGRNGQHRTVIHANKVELKT